MCLIKNIQICHLNNMGSLQFSYHPRYTHEKTIKYAIYSSINLIYHNIQFIHLLIIIL